MASPSGRPCRAQSGPEAKAAFTLVELLVVVGIITVLIAILLPIMSLVNQQARSAACLSNLRQIGQAIIAYASDNRNVIVPADLRDPDFSNPGGRMGNWATILVSGKYLAAPDHPDPDTEAPRNSVFRCPEGVDVDGFTIDAYFAGRQNPAQSAFWTRQAMTKAADGSLVPGNAIQVWYGINADRIGEAYPAFRWPGDNYRTELHLFSEIRNSSEMALVYDGFFHHDGLGNLMGHARHKRGKTTNYLFCDGHAASVETRSLPDSFSDADLDARPFPKFKLRQR